MNIRTLALLCSTLYFSFDSIAQTPAVLAASEKVVVSDGNTNAEMATTAWGASHGLFFGAKVQYSGSQSLWDYGNTVYSNASGPYSFGAFSIGYIANGGDLAFFDGGPSTGANQLVNWQRVMTMQRGGRIGIATSSPQAQLDVNGDVRVATYLRIGSMPSSTNNLFRVLGQEGIGSVDANNKVAYLMSQNGVCAVSAYDYANNQPLPLDVNVATTNTFINRNGGRVIIGTNNDPLAAEYKLAVTGSILAEKIKVKQQPWPDYVFEHDYHLPTLQETETFIKKNKHLPGMPSAAVITKEGLDLGSNQADLLKKIEELTLYLIEQDKRLAASSKHEESLTGKLQQQQQEIDQQQNELDQLKKEVQALLNGQNRKS